jgi:hypothetical protein
MNKVGQEFVTHELNEAIAIQQAIVEATGQLARSHPLDEGREALGRLLGEGEHWLQELQRLGEPFGATGEQEEVAAAGANLLRETTSKAAQSPDEAYEAHAVLLMLHRKQQDGAGSLLKIGKAMGQEEIHQAGAEMQKATKGAADELSNLLNELAVRIATEQVGSGQTAQA